MNSGYLIHPPPPFLYQIVNFVSKAQCKLVDLMAAAGNGGGNSSSGASSSRQSTSPSKTSSSSPSSVEEKRFKILNDNLESLHKRVQDGTEEVTELIEAVMNGSLEPLQKKVTIALGDECEAIERKLSEGQFNQEAMIRNLFNVMDIKLEDSFAKVEDVVSAITKRLVEIHQTKMMMAEEEEKEKEARVVTGSDGELASILTLLQQISSKINITSSSPSQIPNNSMLLSLNEKIISLTKLTEQIKESQASRFSTMDEKLRLFTSIGGGGGGGGSINNSLVKSSIISGQEVDASVDGNVAVSAETIQSNLMDVATKVSRKWNQIVFIYIQHN